MEMYFAGVSVRRVEDITEAMWDTRFSSSNVSQMNKNIYQRIESLANSPAGWRTCLRDARWNLAQTQLGGEVKNIALLVAVGVRADGHREMLGVAGPERNRSRAKA